MNLFAKLLNIIPEFEPEKRKRRILPNGLLLWFAFLPLVWGLILSFVILSHKTPGFRLEATQHYFVVSKIDTPVNSVLENSFITKISGMEYGQILGALLDFNTDASSPTLTLRENGVERTIHYKTLPISLADYFKGIWLSLLFVLSITFLVVTSLVRSPKEQPADLVLLTLTLFCLLIVNEFPYHFGLLSPKLLSFSFLSVAMTHWLAFSAWTHFVLQFPVERQFLTGKPLIISAIYLIPPGVAIGISWALSTDSNDFWKLLQYYRCWATPGIIIGTLAKHIIDYRRLESSLAKSQLKLLMCGGFTGISPFFFLYLLPNLILGQPLITFNVVILIGMLLPLTICLAIVRYNLMDVDRLISKGVTYIILILLFLLGYSGFIFFFKHWVWGRGELSQEVSILFILFIALVFNPIKTRLQSIIDRIFLKDPINYGVLLHAFSNKIVRSIKLADLVELLTRKLPEEFRIQKTRLIICHGNRIRVYPEDDDLAKNNEIPERIIQALKANKEYLCVYEDDSNLKKMGITRQMEAMECPVAYGIKSSQNFFGVLLLGNKANGKLYSRGEIQIFATLANTASIALENSFMYESLKESRDQVHQMFNKVIQAEKLATIGEMTTVLTHEIRNPLAIIRSSAEFLADQKRDRKIQEELLFNILQEIDTLNIVINNTLGLARYKPPEFKPVDICRQIRLLKDQWTRSVEHRSNVDISLELQVPVPAIHADEKQLSQIFVNLIMNSEEAMAEGGQIKIKVYDAPRDNGIVLLFKDTGSGISQEHEKNIFKKFYTEKESGLGLGLAVCDQIVSAHNGSIILENRKEQGACARVCLPYLPHKKYAEQL